MTFVDIREASWRISWLVLGLLAASLALICGLFLLLNIPGHRPVGITSGFAFTLYYTYLFMIGPPDSINWYFISSSAILVLGVATIILKLGSNGQRK
jgi:hypothetical protein